MADEEEEVIPVETEDILIDSEKSMEITWKSISRKRDDCWRITITAGVYITEHYQTVAVGIVPIVISDDFWTDPTTIYSKDFVIEYIWGEDITTALYTDLVDEIQADIYQHMKESYTESNAAGPINLLNANVSYNPNWTP